MGSNELKFKDRLIWAHQRECIMGGKWTTPDVLKSLVKPKRGRRKKERRKKIGKTRAGRFWKAKNDELGVSNRDADEKSWTRIRKNALYTVQRQAVERVTSKRGYHTG
ncbi:hypothetical protein TNCV_3515751 [Trichonephila clavipes]|nr:hypothetical protein TNCV_3515751 [Trichonephila clavipes]